MQVFFYGYKSLIVMHFRHPRVPLPWATDDLKQQGMTSECTDKHNAKINNNSLSYKLFNKKVRKNIKKKVMKEDNW